MNEQIKIAKQLHKELEKDPSNTDAMLRLTEFMAHYEGDDRIVSSEELLEKVDAMEDEERYFTGIERLDSILDGFRNNQLIALSAPTKAGKTQFSIHLARRLPNVTMFLFEETAEEVLYKYRKKNLELPKFYTPNHFDEINTDWLYTKMIESWTKHGSRIFFIDHLHYVIPEGNENTTYKIKKVVQDLKQFCKRHNFTIFLIAHIKHQSLQEPPGVEDIRDSSFVIQYADTTLILWRETYNSGAKEHKKLYNYTNNLLVNVALNRRINFNSDRNTGLVDLTFNTDTWSYEDSLWYTDWVEGNREEDVKKKSIYENIE